MKTKAYVVFQGRQPGVYDSWSDCQQQVKSFPSNKFQGYPDRFSADIAWATWKQSSGVSEQVNQPPSGARSRAQWAYNPVHASAFAPLERPPQTQGHKRSRKETSEHQQIHRNKRPRKDIPAVSVPQNAKSSQPWILTPIIDLTTSDDENIHPSRAVKPVLVLGKSAANIPSPINLPTNMDKAHTAITTSNNNIVTQDAGLPLAIEEQAPVTLTPEQEAVVSLALQRRNIFLTGAAGSGKTATLLEILRRFKERFPEKKEEEFPRVQVVAPTGIAALPLNGKTIYSFAGWKPDSLQHSMKDLLEKVQKRVIESMKRLEVLIVEEISMVENQLLERLNLLMQHALKSNLPFGGKQIIFLGDFHQIPPVKPFQNCMLCGEEMKAREISPVCDQNGCKLRKKAFRPGDKWAFKAPVWQDLDLRHIKLQQIHRQKDSRFQDVLNKIRNGISLSDGEWGALTKQKESLARTFPVRLMSLKTHVEGFNRRQLNSLQTPIVSWEALDNSWKVFYTDFDRFEPRSSQIQRELAKHRQDIDTYHRFSKRLELKVGAKVVLLSNVNPKRGLVNGTQGEVMGFTNTEGWPQDDGKKSKEKERQDETIREFQKQRGTICPVVRFANGQTMAVLPVAQESLRGSSQDRYGVCRTQIPLALAWALSIHKSQGMTLPCVEVSSQHIFEQGQLYVALSRATCIEGLTVTGYSRDVMAVDKDVLEFYQNTTWL